jgi:hypothetical protein
MDVNFEPHFKNHDEPMVNRHPRRAQRGVASGTLRENTAIETLELP